MSRLPGENKNIFFFELLPFANFEIENLMCQKLLQLGASNLVSLWRIMRRLHGEHFKKNHFFFFASLPIANFDRKLDISKT